MLDVTGQARFNQRYATMTLQYNVAMLLVTTLIEHIDNIISV